jgi:hypothetical protein
LQDFRIFVDASTGWGIGILITDRWYAFKALDGWDEDGRDICWLEAVALELLVYFLIQLGITESHILIHSDNNGAIGAHSKGASRNSEINLCVRRTFAATTENLIFPKFVYVPSADNPSDPISRGKLGPSGKQLTREFVIPADISPFFTDAHGP